MAFDPLAPLPSLTADLPGIGGRIKTVPEDFEVEEIPAYQPCGQGEHLYLWIEKRDLAAEFFVRQVARRLEVPVSDVGTAGLKDRRAITRQWVSVPVRAESRLPQLEGNGIRLLAVSRHGNKLKPGHLQGNRFRVFLRDVQAAAERLPPILERLKQQGVPNFYGPQRFGRDGDTVRLGFAMLRGEPLPVAANGRSPNPRNPFLRKMALSAAQSALFNYYLAQRLTDGLFRRVLPGDVMAKWPVGGLFIAQDVAQEQHRFDIRETVTTGPIFGIKTFAAQSEAAVREARVLAEAELSEAHFLKFRQLLQGTRRHNLVYVEELSAAIVPEGVWLQFRLPAGCYATVLLREVMKSVTVTDDPDG